MELNILQVIQGVNMGDHGETVTNAVTVPPDTTVAELAQRALTKEKAVWSSLGQSEQREPIKDAYLVIRIAEPLIAPEPAGEEPF